MTHTADTIATLEKLRQKLAGLAWGGGNLFERVLMFDDTEWDRAARELFAWQGRMALILLRSMSYDREVAGPRLYIHRMLDCTIILTARAFADRREAVFSETAPGLLKMLDIVSGDVPGDLGNGCVAVPLTATIEDLQRDKEPGRVVAQMQLQLIDNITHIPLNMTSWRPR
jgi:hypothetical protein